MSDRIVFDEQFDKDGNLIYQAERTVEVELPADERDALRVRLREFTSDPKVPEWGRVLIAYVLAYTRDSRNSNRGSVKIKLDKRKPKT
jgi:hypothetical protein